MARVLLFHIFILGCFSIAAQTIPIGSWQTHYANRPAFAIEYANGKIYLGGTQLFTFDIENNEYSQYSKVNGLSDVNVTLVRYDKVSKFMIVVYENANIDLIYDNTFYNIPDIKNLNLTGSKRINDIYFNNGLIYLSADFGIVVLNPIKKEIKETYTLQLNSQVLEVKSLTFFNGNIYAATSGGIYFADETNPILQNFANWTLLNANPKNFIFTQNNTLFTTSVDSLFKVNSASLEYLYHSQSPIIKARTGVQDFFLCETDNTTRQISIFNGNGIKIDSSNSNINPRDVVEVSNTELWEADFWEGMIKLNSRRYPESKNPNSLPSNTTYNLNVFGDDLYVSAGGENSWVYTFNGDGFSKYNNGTWTTYNRTFNTSGMDSVKDIMEVLVDKRNNYIYAASYAGGLLELHPDNTHVIYRGNNSAIGSQIGNEGAYIIAGLAFDDNNNLWMSNYGADHQLVVKKADGMWQNFSFVYSVSEKSASQVVIDNANQKWLMAPRGTGVFVLNDNNTIDVKSDDQYKKLTTGIGYGNLPNNEVTCLAKDNDGKIWVGTVDGIAIFNCPESMFASGSCDAELKIVKYDLNAGLLFQREWIKSIAVDGANNKWIGTNNGVWLISDDAEKILARFNKDNSPLPTNEIKKILVHPKTGEVFIATARGLVSFRGNATQGAETNDDLLIFPNPVPSDYTGTIAIKGLVENADVRITDVSGQLVYRTIAQGGQAVWNGKNYKGNKPRTGVYYVFVTNSDGTQTKTGKFIFNE